MASGGGRTFILNVKGNIKSGELSLLNPHTEIESNLWQFCIYEIGFAFESSDSNLVDAVIGIKLNLFSDERYSELKEVETFLPYLNLIEINSKRKFFVVRPEKCWYYINKNERKINFFFENIATNKPFKANCNVTVLLQIQRVK